MKRKPDALDRLLGRKKRKLDKIRNLNVISVQDLLYPKDKVFSLQTLASKVVAANISLESIEKKVPSIPEPVLEKIIFFAFPRNESDIYFYSCQSYSEKKKTDSEKLPFNMGLSILEAGLVYGVTQIGFHLSGLVSEQCRHITPKHCRSCVGYKVSVAFDRCKITSVRCACGGKGIFWCQHVVALILFRIRRPSDVAFRKPISDSLAQLDRIQLQKLAQYLIAASNEDLVPNAQVIVDELMLPNSKINQIWGAPDPTGGMSSGELSNWYLDEEQVKEQVRHHLASLACTAVNTFVSSSSATPATNNMTNNHLVVPPPPLPPQPSSNVTSSSSNHLYPSSHYLHRSSFTTHHHHHSLAPHPDEVQNTGGGELSTSGPLLFSTHNPTTTTSSTINALQNHCTGPVMAISLMCDKVRQMFTRADPNGTRMLAAMTKQFLRDPRLQSFKVRRTEMWQDYHRMWQEVTTLWLTVMGNPYAHCNREKLHLLHQLRRWSQDPICPTENMRFLHQQNTNHSVDHHHQHHHHHHQQQQQQQQQQQHDGEDDNDGTTNSSLSGATVMEDAISSISDDEMISVMIVGSSATTTANNNAAQMFHNEEWNDFNDRNIINNNNNNNSRITATTFTESPQPPRSVFQLAIDAYFWKWDEPLMKRILSCHDEDFDVRHTIVWNPTVHGENFSQACHRVYTLFCHGRVLAATCLALALCRFVFAEWAEQSNAILLGPATASSSSVSASMMKSACLSSSSEPNINNSSTTTPPTTTTAYASSPLLAVRSEHSPDMAFRHHGWLGHTGNPLVCLIESLLECRNKVSVNRHSWHVNSISQFLFDGHAHLYKQHRRWSTASSSSSANNAATNGTNVPSTTNTSTTAPPPPPSGSRNSTNNSATTATGLNVGIHAPPSRLSCEDLLLCCAFQLGLLGLCQQRLMPLSANCQEKSMSQESHLLMLLEQMFPLTRNNVSTSTTSATGGGNGTNGGGGGGVDNTPRCPQPPSLPLLHYLLVNTTRHELSNGWRSGLGERVHTETFPMHRAALYMFPRLLSVDQELAFLLGCRALRLPILEARSDSEENLDLLLLLSEHRSRWSVMRQVENSQCELALTMIVQAATCHQQQRPFTLFNNSVNLPHCPTVGPILVPRATVMGATTAHVYHPQLPLPPPPTGSVVRPGGVASNSNGSNNNNQNGNLHPSMIQHSNSASWRCFWRPTNNNNNNNNTVAAALVPTNSTLIHHRATVPVNGSGLRVTSISSNSNNNNNNTSTPPIRLLHHVPSTPSTGSTVPLHHSIKLNSTGGISVGGGYGPSPLSPQTGWLVHQLLNMCDRHFHTAVSLFHLSQEILSKSNGNSSALLSAAYYLALSVCRRTLQSLNWRRREMLQYTVSCALENGVNAVLHLLTNWMYYVKPREAVSTVLPAIMAWNGVNGVAAAVAAANLNKNSSLSTTNHPNALVDCHHSLLVRSSVAQNVSGLNANSNNNNNNGSSAAAVSIATSSPLMKDERILQAWRQVLAHVVLRDPIHCSIQALSLCDKDPMTFDSLVRLITDAAEQGSIGCCQLFLIARFLRSEQQHQSTLPSSNSSTTANEVAAAAAAGLASSHHRSSGNALPSISSCNNGALLTNPAAAMKAFRLALQAVRMTHLTHLQDRHPSANDILWCCGLAQSLGVRAVEDFLQHVIRNIQCPSLLSDILHRCVACPPPSLPAAAAALAPPTASTKHHHPSSSNSHHLVSPALGGSGGHHPHHPHHPLPPPHHHHQQHHHHHHSLHHPSTTNMRSSAPNNGSGGGGSNGGGGGGSTSINVWDRVPTLRHLLKATLNAYATATHAKLSNISPRQYTEFLDFLTKAHHTFCMLPNEGLPKFHTLLETIRHSYRGKRKLLQLITERFGL